MKFTDWTIDKNCFHYIVDNTPPNGLILELGSGATSAELSKLFTVYSIEDNPVWVGKYETNYIYADIRNYSWGQWYDIDEIKGKIPSHYDTLLIDGPIAAFGRLGFLRFINTFDTSALIIVDDIHRKEERELFYRLSLLLRRKTKTVKENGKAFGVIERSMCTKCIE